LIFKTYSTTVENIRRLILKRSHTTYFFSDIDRSSSPVLSSRSLFNYWFWRNDSLR